MAKNAKTNASNVANTINATISGVYVGNYNSNLLRISIEGENDIIPYYKDDEIVYGRTILVTAGELRAALSNSVVLLDLAGFYEEVRDVRADVIDRAIELRKRSKKSVYVSKELPLLSSILRGANIKITPIEVPANGTYTDRNGREVPNPTTNGDYSSAIIIGRIDIDDSNIDTDDAKLELIDDVRFQYEHWDRHNKAIDDRMASIINNKAHKAKPKSLAEKAAEKAAEEDE